LAVGIKHNTFNKKILEDALCTTTVEAWKMCRSYVECIRKDRNAPTAYEHLQKLAEEWDELKE
jgi:hypothetical protein